MRIRRLSTWLTLLIGLAWLHPPDPARSDWSRSFHGTGLNHWVISGTEFRGDFVVGGYFVNAGAHGVNHVARWDGADWSPLGSGTNDWVTFVRPFRDKLVVGGYFSRAGNQDANHIALWDGERWESLGDGLEAPVGAAADFAAALTVASRGDVYRWDGSYWSRLGNGTFNSAILTMTVFHGALYVGGGFEAYDPHGGNRESIRGLAKWVGDRWVEVPGWDGGLVRSLTEYEGKLVVTGHFTVASGDGVPNEALLGFWDGSQWSLHDGPNPGFRSPNQSLLGFTPAPDGGFWINGNFHIGSPPAPEAPGVNLARWDGAHWIVPHVMPHGNSNAVLPTADGVLVAGDFAYLGDAADPTPIGYAAFWDGTNWSRLGPSGLGLTAPVADLEMFQGRLVVAGDKLDRHIAVLDGDHWGTLGDGLPSAVRDMTVLDGKLVAAGYLRFDPGVDNIRVAAWDGGQWEILGDGFSGSVHAATVYQGDLVVGGYTDRIGALPVNGVARWDGSAWIDMGAGMPSQDSSPVLSLFARGNELFAGGSNYSQNGGHREARWDGTTPSSIAMRRPGR